MTPEQDRRPSASGRRLLRREITAGFRRAVGLTALGTVLPGAGLTRTRHRKTGWLLVAVAVGSAVILGYTLLTKGMMKTALSVVSSPNTLQVAAVALLIAGAVWAASIILTAVSTRPARLDRTRTRLLAAFTTVMVAFVAASSYKVAEYATVTKDTIDGLFVTSANGTAPTDAPKIVEGKDPWAETPRVNILLLGSDAGVGREGTRTDSMIVASTDTKTGRTVLISLPRNLMRVPIPEDNPLHEKYPNGYGVPYCERGANECMLNAIWTEADEFKAANPEAWPGEDSPGRATVRDVIGETLQLEIDHTVVVDLRGFSQLVDAMGGIDINVKLSAYGTKLPIGGKSDGQGGIIGESGYFEPGFQHLDGYHALWYARTRAADDDYSRMQRQRCVIRAVLDQVNPGSMLTKYTTIARIARNNIYTDIPGENLSAYVELVERIQKAKITSVAIGPKAGINSGRPDFDLIHELVQKALEPPVATATPTPTSTSTGSATSTTSKPTVTTPESTTTTTIQDEDECA
jgi:LCP family protein required for cell wall assembly